MLDFDFFEVLDSVTIARSRKHIQKYYDMADIGTFPTRLKPISLRPHLTDLKEAISYNEIFEQLMLLTLTIYTPTHYILPSKMEKYAELYGDNKVNVGFTQANREQGIRRLTAINLMKRMESSVYSFNLTLTRIKDLINNTIETIDRFDKHSGTTLDLTDISDMDEFDAEDQNSDELFSFGRKVKIDLADMDYVSWRDSLAKDADVLELLTLLVGDITPEHDSKLQELFRVTDNKITHPINEGNKKLIIFTAFADTAGYLYDNVSRYVKDISYDTIEGEYDSFIFTAEKATQSFDKAFLAKKAIQDYVFTDGSADKSIERKFAEDLDAADEVCVYAKLPRTFQIPTPVGNYSPDWAIAFYEGKVKHIFFIAETKGTMESLELRPIEQAKISCAKKLFNEMSTSNVVYHDVDSYQSLLNIMNSL